MATKDYIPGWCLEGKHIHKADKLIIVCDTFSYEDYPVYCSASEIEDNLKKYRENMQKVMEVYDLTVTSEDDINAQMNEKRAYYPNGYAQPDAGAPDLIR